MNYESIFFASLLSRVVIAHVSVSVCHEQENIILLEHDRDIAFYTDIFFTLILKFEAKPYCLTFVFERISMKGRGNEFFSISFNPTKRKPIKGNI